MSPKKQVTLATPRLTGLLGDDSGERKETASKISFITESAVNTVEKRDMQRILTATNIDSDICKAGATKNEATGGGNDSREKQRWRCNMET